MERYGKSYLSYSSIKQALGDMASFDMYMKGELKFKSDALDFGTLYDMILFEKDKALDTYQVLNEQNIVDSLSDKARASKRPKLTSEYKAAIAKLNTEAIENNKMIVSQEDWSKANDMIDRLVDCGLSESHLTGKYQVEFNEELNGVPVRGFLDCLGDGFISDSKSTQSVNKFRYSVRDFSYDIQAYIYTQVFGVEDFYWVVQEKTYPYTPALVKCTENTIFTGEMKFHQAIDKIREFLNKGDEYSPMSEYVEFEV